MSLAGRSIVSIDDLSNEEIEAIFELADKMEQLPRKFWGRAKAKVLATLFYEPSTRTRLSFEAAMQRLGGGTISAWDVNATSTAKGETLADTVRVVGKYADAIALRHPWEGASNLAARYAGVPIINGGDGGHEHPTQTLCDLFTLKKKHRTLKGLTVALCGDLKNGRTIHSLAFALARFNANVVFIPGGDNQIPDYVLARLQREYGAQIQQVTQATMVIVSALFGAAPDSSMAPSDVNAIYMTPSQPHQLALMMDEGIRMDFRITAKDSFAIYVTRFQKERTREPRGDSERGRYPVVTREVLSRKEFKNISILHPLPRVDEVSPDVDQDERSLYFEQAGCGIPVRMALLHFVLGLDKDSPPRRWKPYERECRGLLYTQAAGLACKNDRCVTRHEPQNAPRRFEVIEGDVPALRCLYCDQETTPKFYGHNHNKERVCYPVEDLRRNRPNLANVVFFESPAEAVKSGYKLRDALARAGRRKSEPDCVQTVKT